MNHSVRRAQCGRSERSSRDHFPPYASTELAPPLACSNQAKRGKQGKQGGLRKPIIELQVVPPTPDNGWQRAPIGLNQETPLERAFSGEKRLQRGRPKPPVRFPAVPEFAVTARQLYPRFPEKQRSTLALRAGLGPRPVGLGQLGSNVWKRAAKVAKIAAKTALCRGPKKSLKRVPGGKNSGDATGTPARSRHVP
jgi:hypothetical protein